MSNLWGRGEWTALRDHQLRGVQGLLQEEHHQQEGVQVSWQWGAVCDDQETEEQVSVLQTLQVSKKWHEQKRSVEVIINHHHHLIIMSTL